MSLVAAVDVGTNSTRLLVATSTDPPEIVERTMRITRIGEGVDANRRLDDEALARTLDCVAEYARRWRELGAQRVRIAATSAIRDAVDRDRFFAGVGDLTGVEAEVLTGAEEGRLAFLGATGRVKGEPPFLVLDIGGGSTEFILGGDEPEAMDSRQLGCVRLTERELRSDPPTVDEIAEAAGAIDAELDAVVTTVDPERARTLVGVAGTITTIGALYLDLASYQPDRIHGTRVPAADVGALTRRLCEMTTAQRAQLGPMAPGREDVIHAGALILRGVVDRFGFADVLVSEADMLDGLAQSLVVG